MVDSKAVIFGCAGLELTPGEATFFSIAQPIGFILFGRNCDTPGQLRMLINDLRNSIKNDNALILIDQEGGRVARLASPHWRHPPAAHKFAKLAKKDLALACEALMLNVRLIGRELRELGINVDCLPVLDIPLAGSDPIIGDRAYGTEPNQVSVLGRVACNALLKEGVMPVIKHIPGHGRANVDSHKALPIVDIDWAELSRTDFMPFKALSDMPLAMTAHVIYSNIDDEYPATTSQKIIQDVIRGEICFKGLLMSDDLSMQALVGSVAGRAVASLQAGCDVVLHCNGAMSEMVEIASVVQGFSDESADRLAIALARIKDHETVDRQAALERLAELGIN
jgi:beta-N-acetylhexosaminidase